MTITAPSGVATPRQVVDRILDALTSGDIPAIAAAAADDVVWEVVGADYLPAGHRFAGKDAVLNDFLLGTVAASFDFTHPLELSVTNVHEAGSSVIVEWVARAVTARGRRYENTYCVVFTVRDGLLLSVREYCDTERAKRVIFD